MDQLRLLSNKQINPTGWTPASIKSDPSDKVIVVTGGNAGLGYQTILELSKHSPKRLFLTARSRAKYDEAIAKVRQETPEVDTFTTYIEMDLASLSSVKRASQTILDNTDTLDILINNAGIMAAPIKLTEDGYENHFGTNHMGHALLTKLLMPILLRTAEQPGSNVRIINVSSTAHMQAAKAGFDSKAVLTDMGNTSILTRYGQSKLANVLHARSLAQKYPTITSVSVHPGRVATGLLDDMFRSGRGGWFTHFQNVYDWLFTPVSMEKGAWSQLWCATISKSQLESGAYYVPVGKLDRGSRLSQDQALAEQLWEWQEAEFVRLGYA